MSLMSLMCHLGLLGPSCRTSCWSGKAQGPTCAAQPSCWSSAFTDWRTKKEENERFAALPWCQYRFNINMCANCLDTVSFGSHWLMLENWRVWKSAVTVLKLLCPLCIGYAVSSPRSGGELLAVKSSWGRGPKFRGYPLAIKTGNGKSFIDKSLTKTSMGAFPLQCFITKG